MPDPTASAGQIETVEQFGQTPSGTVARWRTEIKLAEKYFKPYWKRAKVCVERYRDERSDNDQIAAANTKYNIFWSNVETLKPAIYARSPKVVVERRYDDADPIGRAAATILERATEYAKSECPFDPAMLACRDDYLIVGRGTAWVRFVPHFADVPLPTLPGMPPQPKEYNPEVADEGAQISNDAEMGDTSEMPPQTIQVLYNAECVVDYVFWEDFLHSPARQWDEVRWIARRAYMTRDELVERFGPCMKSQYQTDAREIPLDFTPDGMDKSDAEKPENQIFKKAVVWEIWDKAEKKVIWLAPGYSASPLDERDDPLNLHNFFPAPKPIWATLTTDSLKPIPDYAMYQDQAREMDSLTARIADLSKVIRAVGVYDADVQELARIFDEGQENALVPITNWPSFAAKQGLKGSMDMIDIAPFANTLAQLYNTRTQVKGDLYEITGISDIIRGNSAPSETATAQQIKGQFASLRLQERQARMQEFARETLSIMAEVIAEHFPEDTIRKAADVDNASDPALKQQFAQAIELLRNDKMRTFRITVETDSTIAIDEQADKQAANEFLSAVGMFFKNIGPIVAQSPEMAPIVGEMLLFMVRRFRVGRSLESAIENALQQVQQNAAKPKPPSPQEQQQQFDNQIKQRKLEIDAYKAQSDATIKGAATAADIEEKRHYRNLDTVDAVLNAAQPQQPPVIVQ